MHVTKTRKIIWMLLILTIVATYAFKIHVAREPSRRSARLDESVMEALPVSSVLDLSGMPEEIPVQVSGLGVDPQQRSAVVFLVTDSEDYYMPIFIGEYEASAISRSLEGVKPMRPLTHELLADIVDKMDGEITKMVVSDMVNGTFISTLTVQKPNGESVEVDARPSDSIAIALLRNAEIYVAASVMEKAGYKIDEDDEDVPGVVPDQEEDIPSEPTPPRPEMPEGELI